MTRTFLTGARLFDGTGGAVVPGALVVVDGARVAFAGAATALDAPRPGPGDRVVDLPDHTLLPGLHNVHVHLGLKRPFPERRIDPYPEGYRVLLCYRRALEALLGGTTTLRCLGEPHGADIQVRDAIARGMLPGPRILSAGHALTATGGHWHESVATVEGDGPVEMRRLAREQLRAGADLVKVMATGGLASPRERLADRQLTADEIAAAVDVAHTAGRRVASHTAASDAIRACVRLGVNSIEHGYSLDDETAALMAETGTTLVPTLAITRNLEMKRASGAPAWMIERARAAAAEHLASVGRAARAGVTIACGSDLLPSDAVDGTTGTIFELEGLVLAGLTPAAALRAATLSSAQLCGTDAVSGTLTAGKAADLIGVCGRPDVTIADLRRIELVMRDGVVVRSEIPALPADLCIPSIVPGAAAFDV